MARGLGEAASQIINPCNVLVVDESLYEFNGVCPIRRYIPRKPHPNGLLVYGMAGYFNVGQDKLPFVLDFEPYFLQNEVSAQEAMIRLHSRLRKRKQYPKPHLVVDSAFGSFDRLTEIKEAGGEATMSMAANVKPWLWELLDWNCGIDEGRAAVLADGTVVSSFKVLSETGNEHQIKTISSGCQVVEDSSEEEIVVKVVNRRDAGDSMEYLTQFLDGHTEWFAARQFIDDDGTINISWLSYASDDDLTNAFETFTHNQLKVGVSRKMFVKSKLSIL